MQLSPDSIVEAFKATVRKLHKAEKTVKDKLVPAAGKTARGLHSAAGKAAGGFIPAAKKAGKGLGAAAGKAGAAVKRLGPAAGKAGKTLASAAGKAGAAARGLGPVFRSAAGGIGAAAARLIAALRNIAASAAEAVRNAAGSLGGKMSTKKQDSKKQAGQGKHPETHPVQGELPELRAGQEKLPEKQAGHVVFPEKLLKDKAQGELPEKKAPILLPALPAKRHTRRTTFKRQVRKKLIIRRMTAGSFLAAACVLGGLAGVVLLGPALRDSADAGSGTMKNGESLEMLRGQKAGAENTPLAESMKGILNASEESLRSIRGQVDSSLREEYRQILDRGEGDSFRPKSDFQKKLWEEVREERREELQEDPFLILVNKWHYLPEDYEVEPVDLPNGQRISSLVYEHLEEMLADCAEAGGTPIVCSGYRPHYYQVGLFSDQIDRWLYAGYGQEEAEDLAATAVAVPGTSEHELGLAADIYSSENMDLDESQVGTFTQQWLMKNCWRYGFVLRYPKDKSDITGIIFEPWHYRYVGLTHAKKIFDAEICLEEYLDETEHP